jgi:hypothetical protein
MNLFIFFLLFLWFSLTLVLSKPFQSNFEISGNKEPRDGELSQLVYAARAVQRADPVIAYCNHKFGYIAIVVIHKGLSRLDRRSHIRRKVEILREDKEGTMAAVLVGYAPDCLYALSQLKSIMQNHLLIYGECPSDLKLVQELSSWMVSGLLPQPPQPNKKNNHKSSIRPLATQLLLAHQPVSKDLGRLVLADNAGGIGTASLLVVGKAAVERIQSNVNQIEQQSESKIESISETFDVIIKTIKEEIEEEAEVECWLMHEGRCLDLIGLRSLHDSIPFIKEKLLTMFSTIIR